MKLPTPRIHELITVVNEKGEEAKINMSMLADYVLKGYKQKDAEEPEKKVEKKDGESVPKEPAEETVKSWTPKKDDPVGWTDAKGKDQEGVFVKLTSDPSIASVLKDGNQNPSKVPLAKLELLED